MKNDQRTKLIRSSGAKRSTNGQALAEGAAILMVMVPICAILILLLLNTYFIGSYNLRVQQVAADAARRVSEAKWWLGMERPDYDQSMSEQAATEAISGQLATMGLSLNGSPTYTYTQNVMLRKKAITLVRVDFEVTGMHSAKGFFFPSFLTLHASGISSDAEHAVTRHGMAFLQFVDSNGNGLGIRVPAYNATIGRSTPANPIWLRAGRSTGSFPVAYLRLSASSDGSFLEKDYDTATPDGTVVTVNDGRAEWRDK